MVFLAIWSTPVTGIKTDNIWVWPDDDYCAKGDQTEVKAGTSGRTVVKIIQDPKPTILESLEESIEISSDSDEPLSKTKQKQKSVSFDMLKTKNLYGWSLTNWWI